MTLMTDVAIGTAIVAYIEPHAGQAARVQPLVRARPLLRGRDGGPGHVRGRALGRDARVQGGAPAGRDWFGDPARGSYLTTVLAAAGDARRVGRRGSPVQYAATPPERLFAGRDHLHTAVYGFDWELRAGNAPPAATALDHRFVGRGRDRGDR